MEDTFELRTGQVLNLRPVKATMLRHLLSKFGGLRNVLDDPKGIEKLTGAARFRALDAVDQIFNYCAGFGVVDDPTEEELDELAELGFRVDKPPLARVSWLRLLLDDEEAGELLGAVMLLTLRGVEPEEEEKEESIEDEKDTRIAELEAKLAAIEGEGEVTEDGS
jgi:hypothetical protein